jgi:1,4-dihydroxy-2-naphthoate octaprenyltransferase
MTPGQADKLLAVTHALAAVLSYKLGVTSIFLVYVILITAYNDYGGGNKSGIIRNLFCGAGFACYFGGAVNIATSSKVSMSSIAWKWTFIVTLGVLATTIQTQELRDEAGDRARDRRTLVTELGRKLALWTVFPTVTFWSIYIPLIFFGGSWTVALLPLGFGGALLTTAIRSYYNDNNKLDRQLYKLWCLWMFGFCPLPFLVSVLT